MNPYDRKRLALYVVSSALIAVNALCGLSLAFALPVRHWGAIGLYVSGFVILSTAHNVILRRWHDRATGLVGPTWRIELAKAADAVDPSAADPGKSDARTD